MANATNYLTGESPHPDQLSKGSVQHGSGVNIMGTDVWLGLRFNGAPVNGVVKTGTAAGWADIGSTGFDATTGIWYSNKGTKASPVWAAFN